MSPAEIIFNHFKDQLEKTKIKKTDGVVFEVDMQKYNNTLDEIREMLAFHLKDKGLFSTILLHQLTRHRCQIGEVFGEALEYYQISDILSLIERIELSRTKGEPFERLPLKNLYKIHHNPFSGVDYSLLFNIKNYWFNQQGQIKKDKKKNYEQILTKVNNENISHIAKCMHLEAVHSKELTGEWLIYAKQDERNYFLCLATHCEGDQNIFDNKILNCYQEFPELNLPLM